MTKEMRDILKDISNRKIKNTNDFIIKYLKHKNFKGEIDNKSISNGALIKDFQEAEFLTEQFISSLEYIDRKYALLKYNKENPKNIPIIQYFQNKPEISRPLKERLEIYEKNNIILTDSDSLRNLIEFKFKEEKEYYEIKHLKLQLKLIYIALILPVAIFLATVIFGIITMNSIQKVKLINDKIKIDSVYVAQQKYLENNEKTKIDSLTKTNIDKTKLKGRQSQQ